MDLLCGYHAKNVDTCKWVIQNCDENTDNITVKAWIRACKEYLQSHNDGPATVSTEQSVKK
jgi:hypothetical protein